MPAPIHSALRVSMRFMTASFIEQKAPGWDRVWQQSRERATTNDLQEGSTRYGNAEAVFLLGRSRVARGHERLTWQDHSRRACVFGEEIAPTLRKDKGLDKDGDVWWINFQGDFGRGTWAFIRKEPVEQDESGIRAAE
jgi:hypothetical protein